MTVLKTRDKPHFGLQFELFEKAELMQENQAIQAILAEVRDTLTGRLAAELNLHVVSVVDETSVTLTLCAGFPHQPLEQSFVPYLKVALEKAFSDKKIDIILTSLIKAHRSQMPGKGLRGVKNTIAVASGKGGVGKSTLAVNIAAALAKTGARVGILDADIYGPSIPMMLGEVEPIQMQDDKYLPVMAHGLYAMSIGYLTSPDKALIWRGPMLAKSLIQMLDMTLWDELDYLFIDLPPGTGDIQLSLVQKIPLAGAIVVTTPQSIATLDAEKAIQMFQRTGIECLGVVENMAMHYCAACGHEEALFGQGGAEALCQQYQQSFLGRLPLDGQIREAGDVGAPAVMKAGPVADAVMSVAMILTSELSKRPINYSDKFPDLVQA